jgi:general secretion pathway protein H
LLRVEVERLAQLLDLAATESRFTGEAIAWTASGPGYRFWRFSEASGWLPIGTEALRPRTLPPGMTVSRLQVDNTRSLEQMRLQFNPHGTAPSFRVEMSLGAARYTVASSPLGELSVLPQ